MSSMMNGSTAAAAVDKLTVRFGKTTAVDDLSFSMESGTVYALLGRNGSGKSTTVRCLLGQLKPCAGNAYLLGREAWSSRGEAMRQVAVVPETPDVPPDITARQAARFVASLHERWDGDGFKERLRRFSVPDHVAFARLSKGQRKQVSLALALAVSPKLLILDDPTLGLDPVARKSLFEELISDLADRGTSVLITTHDLPGIEGVADQVGLLERGRMVLDDSVESIKGRFRRLRFNQLDGRGDEVSKVLQDLGEVHTHESHACTNVVVSRYSEGARSRLTQALAEAPFELQTMSLEEIFIALCGEGDGGAS